MCAVEREAGARERRRAQRALVHPRPRIGKARTVPLRHLVIGHQVMAQSHRLRGLQMGEARHHAVRMFPGARDQRPAAPSAPLPPRRSRRAPTAGSRSPPDRCGCARCAACPPPGRSAPQGAIRSPCGCPRGPVRSGTPFASYSSRPGQPLRDRRASSPRRCPAPQHRDMRLRSGDVLAPQALVERDRGVYLAHDRRRPFGEAPAPHAVGA
jgi:hypothetical protein